MEKLCCKLCGRSFASPRLMGVQRRSHVVMRPEEQMCRYELRDKERMSWRLKEKAENDMLCTRCGEGFGSNGLNRNGSYEMWNHHHPDVEATEVILPGRAGRKRRRSPDSLTESENELKMGAFCLMLLSRDAGGFADKKDRNYIWADHGKRRRYTCTTCDKSFSCHQALGGHMASHTKTKAPSSSSKLPAAEEVRSSGSKSSENHHKCSTCGRRFASGQALGGHKRSHFVSANNAASAYAVQASAAVFETKQKRPLFD